MHDNLHSIGDLQAGTEAKTVLRACGRRAAVPLPVGDGAGPGLTRFFFSRAAELEHDGRCCGCVAVRVSGEGGNMVSAWWLVVTFMAGGVAGVLVMALMALASDPQRDDPMPPVAR